MHRSLKTLKPCIPHFAASENAEKQHERRPRRLYWTLVDSSPAALYRNANITPYTEILPPSLV